MWTVDLSDSSCGDMLHPLLLLLVVVLAVFDEDSHVVDIRDSGVSSHSSPVCFQSIQSTTLHSYKVSVYFSGYALVLINVVTLRRARLVPG